MEKEIVILGLMMVLPMTAVTGYSQRVGVGTAAQTTAKSTVADTTAADVTVDTMQADVAGTETTVVAQSDDSYQYVSTGDTVAAAKNKSAHVLDVRGWGSYMKGRVADPTWCPILPLEDDSLTDVMNTYAKEGPNDGKKIYIICNSSKRSAEKAASVLKEVGIDGSLIYTVEGGTKALESKKSAPTANRADGGIGWKMITAIDTLRTMGGSDVQILGVCDNDVYAEDHLEESLQYLLKEIEDPAAQTAIYKMAKEKMDPFKPVYPLYHSGNKYAKTGISITGGAGFDVDNLFIIENGMKNKDVQAAFVTEQDNPSGGVVSPDHAA